MGVKYFSEKLKDEAEKIWDAIYQHPFVTEMREGLLPLDKFRFYIKQDYAYLIDFARCLGLAAANAEDMATMRTLASLFQASLTVEMEMLEALCARIFIPLEELHSTEPAPSNRAYTHHLLNIAYSGTLGELIAAMLPCMWTYEKIGELFGRNPSTNRQQIYENWAATYRTKEYADLVNLYKELVDGTASQAGTRVKERMRKYFIVSSKYEYMFWEMAYNKESWPI